MPVSGLNRAQNGVVDRVHLFWVQFVPVSGLNRAQNGVVSE